MIKIFKNSVLIKVLIADHSLLILMDKTYFLLKMLRHFTIWIKGTTDQVQLWVKRIKKGIQDHYMHYQSLWGFFKHTEGWEVQEIINQ
mgnify:CR=1 FL=1